MITVAAPSISSERQPNARLALAARVARVGVRLLLVAVMLLPVYGSLRADGRLAGPLAILGVFVITLVRPEDGLLLCAAFLPIGGPPAALLGCGSLREASTFAFLAGWLLRETVHPGPASDVTTRAVLLPAWLFAGVAAASMLVQLTVAQALEDYPWTFVRGVLRHLASGDFFGGGYPGSMPGVVTLEAIGLFVATVVLARRKPGLATRVLAMMVAGGFAVAGLNLTRVITVSLRAGTLASLRGIRVTSTFPDVNAAGSYLALVALIAVSGAIVNRRTRVIWMVAASSIFAALWFTGSRAGLLGAALGILVVVAVGLHDRMARSWWKPTVGVAAALVVVILMVGIFFPPDAGHRPPVGMLQGRWEMVKVSLRMWRTAPVFGVGMGRYQPLSGTFMDRWFVVVMPTENATNNFLQILAELGLAGFGCFAWLLTVVAARVRRRLTVRDTGIMAGLVGGLSAFLFSCLAGHPLLIPEVALAFWMALGVAACAGPGAERPAGRVPRATRWRHIALAVAIAGLCASIPIRARAFLDREADLTSAAPGFSRWQWDEHGTRFRTMTGRSAFYVEKEVCRVAVPVRLDPTESRRSVDLELRADGSPIQRVRAVRDAWRTLVTDFPPGWAARFRQFELRTTGAAIVRVAKPKLASCGEDPRRAAVNDFNGDMWPDILWRNATTGQTRVWYMAGTVRTGDVALDTESDLNWRCVAVADFDGDGLADIVWQNSATRENRISLMTGRLHRGDLALPTVANPDWRIVGAGDFNQDGHPDLVWRNQATGENVIWLLRDGAYSGRIALPTIADANWEIGAVGDFNGDGWPDLFWRNQATGQNLAWFLVKGVYVGWTALPAIRDRSWRIAGAADFNWDGKADLLWRNVSTGQNLVWYLNNGTYAGFDWLPTLEVAWTTAGGQ